MGPSDKEVRLGRRSLAALATVGLFAACQDPQEPGSQVAANASLVGVEAPYYYYQGTPIYLDLDPQRLVIVSDAPSPASAARQLAGTLGVQVEDAGGLSQLPGHRLLRLTNATAALADRAAATLRADDRFTFVSPVFRTQLGGHEVLLVNQIDVQFRRSVSRAQIDSIIASLGGRVIRRPIPDSGFFAYRLAYPRGADPLAVSQALSRHAAVEWADPDKLTNVRPAYVPTDPYYNLQFHLKNSASHLGFPVDINVERAWDLTKGSSTVRVVIVDDGVDILHGKAPSGNKIYNLDVACYTGGRERAARPSGESGPAVAASGRACTPAVRGQ